MLKQLLNSKKCLILTKGLLLYLFLLTTSSFAQSNSVKTSFSARLLNVEAPTNETFRYNSLLTNGKSETVKYNLSTKLPAGWQVTYRVEGISVTSLQVESGSTKDISIEITCPITTKPDTYKIPVQAISSFDTLKLDLEAVVRGSYAVELTTPTG